LEGGARYLREQLDRFDGDLEKALAAYNAGPGRVEAADGIPNIRETRNYVAAIMGRLSNHSRSTE
jgi:soluble lytic murein transglycosylase-like protein